MVMSAHVSENLKHSACTSTSSRYCKSVKTAITSRASPESSHLRTRRTTCSEPMTRRRVSISDAEDRSSHPRHFFLVTRLVRYFVIAHRRADATTTRDDGRTLGTGDVETNFSRTWTRGRLVTRGIHARTVDTVRCRRGAVLFPGRSAPRAREARSGERTASGDVSGGSTACDLFLTASLAPERVLHEPLLRRACSTTERSGALTLPKMRLCGVRALARRRAGANHRHDTAVAAQKREPGRADARAHRRGTGSNGAMRCSMALSELKLAYHLASKPSASSSEDDEEQVDAWIRAAAELL